MITLLTYAIITLLIGLICGLLPILSKFGSDQHRLKMLTGIASGIIIASAFLVVIPEGFELAAGEEHADEMAVDGEEHEEVHLLVLGGAILAGFLLMLILEGSGIGHAVHEEHHHHSEEHGHDHVHHNSIGWMLVFGLTLHAAVDGLAIGAAAATGSVSVSLTILLAVLIHKGPAALSLGIFSLHERETKKASIRDIVIFSLATPVMIFIAYFSLSNLETHMIGLAMLFSSGTFLYVATVDTLPDIHNAETGRKAMLYVVSGAILLTALLFAVDASGMISHGH
jgi:zinc transporter ZupT